MGITGPGNCLKPGYIREKWLESFTQFMRHEN
jgi:hypothetical protein